jgi:poly(hydroxyalkanoate) depolymerase family esterase
MTRLPMADMAEATRLTREGRLDEAMALLRGAVGNAPVASGSARDAAAPTPSADSSRVLDMQPPSPNTGDAWTAAASDEVSQEGKAAGDRTSGVDPSKMPKALRGLLGRLRKGSRAPGLDRAAKPRRRPTAPPALPDGARFEERMHTGTAGALSYKLYIPSGYHGQPLPLVVMLHGCTQSPDDFAAGTGMNALAEQQLFLVAYPAQTQSANISKCWNWFRPDDQQRGRGEPALIAGITREIMREISVDPRRVYIAGLSAGGAAAAIMGGTYPDLYAAIGVHSGLAHGAAADLPSAFAAMRQGGSAPGAADHSRFAPAGGAPTVVPTIVFHGDCDPTVSLVNADQVIAQSKGAALLRSTVSRGEAAGGIGYTRSVHADEKGRDLLEQWVLHGTGHAWSGGSTAGTYTEPRGPDASREMLRFFLQHAGAAAA